MIFYTGSIILFNKLIKIVIFSQKLFHYIQALKLIDIDNILVNKDVIETKFTCDLSKCKGACCTMESEFGAPLTHEEIDIINEILPVLKDYIPEEYYEEIEKSGYWEEKQGILMTKSKDNRECLFVYYDGEVAKCAIEKAYYDGKVEFKKPISCHLFPIRVEDFGGPVLRYENYADCRDAVEFGRETGITVVNFCKESLVREYGEDWYNKLQERLKDR